MVAIDATISDEIGRTSALLGWLLDRIAQKESDSVRNYAGELLVIYLQQPDCENRRKVISELNGVERVLQNLAPYKRRDPVDQEMEEHAENLFDLLCCLLQEPMGREQFYQCEGIELFLIMFRWILSS